MPDIDKVFAGSIPERDRGRKDSSQQNAEV